MTTIKVINFLFYFFSALAIISSTLVITIKNPVHAVLFLILTFISAANLLFLLEIEFISLILIVVYVGAIAVLFLFVVMMMDIKITESNKNYFKYFPIGSFLGLIFLIEILFVVSKNFESKPDVHLNNLYHGLSYTNWQHFIDYSTNTQILGNVLYTVYFPYFLIAGIILLIAMLGAIVLTLSFNQKPQSQTIYKQIARDFKNAVFRVQFDKN